MPPIWINLSTEQFPASSLLAQGIAAEAAGFDAVGSSDHFQPWWPDGESPFCWPVLSAIAQATERVPVGTGVTPPMDYRYHPVLVAQAFMTIEEMFPGRCFLGVGSGEALNEVPFGVTEWITPKQKVAYFEEALEVIRRLWDGETVTYEGEHIRTVDAKLYTRAPSRPKLYVSAFGPKAAGVAARWGDGIWTLGDPERVPKILDAYRSACEEAGTQPGEVIIQAGFSWAETDEAALESARVWKGTIPPEFYRDDWHDPQAMQDHVADLPDAPFLEANAIGADPQVHLDKIHQLTEMGATIVCLQNFSGADPVAAVEFYGREVLPNAPR